MSSSTSSSPASAASSSSRTSSSSVASATSASAATSDCRSARGAAVEAGGRVAPAGRALGPRVGTAMLPGTKDGAARDGLGRLGLARVDVAEDVLAQADRELERGGELALAQAVAELRFDGSSSAKTSVPSGRAPTGAHTWLRR